MGENVGALPLHLCAAGYPAALVPIRLNGCLVEALVDTGASISVVTMTTIHTVKGDVSRCKANVTLADGHRTEITGEARLSFRLGPLSGTHGFAVLASASNDVILGCDFIGKHGLRPNIAAGCVEFEDGSKPMKFLPSPEMPRVANLTNEVPIISLGEELTEEQRRVLKAVIPEDAFATEARPFGVAKGFMCSIPTGDAYPVRQNPRRVSPGEREVVREQVRNMLAMGAIQPSRSPWASPIVLVAKKDGSCRFCVDYRRVNDITIKDRFPLPQIADMLGVLGGARYFASLDAASGYWQVPMHPDSIEKTAFTCSEGLFEWRVMPFGLCNAPAVYQRMMQEVLSDLLWHSCVVYIDDILVFGDTFDQFVTRTGVVLQRLMERGILLKPSKCWFGRKKVEFLGYVVSGEGVHADPKKTHKIRNFPRPTNPKEVRTFIGMASYYRRFIRDFGTVSAPLVKLTEHDAEWNWSEAQEEAFNKVRNAIADDAVQAHPDYAKPFLVDTDASDIGLGAVLSQVNDAGAERIVMIESRKLNPSEAKWHIREKEALAIIWALEKFRPFLFGAKTTIRTDHSSLTWLLNAKSGRLSRWALRLAEFSPLNIVHRSGKSHGNADAFTRVFAGSDAVPDNATIATMVTSPLVLPAQKEMMAQQATDPTCQTLRQKGCVMRDGLVGLGDKNRWRPVQPKAMFLDLAKQWHASPLGAHLGARKTLSQLSRHFVIPGKVHLKAVIEGCLACKQRKAVKQKIGHMASRPPSTPWRTVAMDYAGPFDVSDSGNQYVLVITDQFTKWVELVASPTQKAMDVVRAFYERIICRWGCPLQVLSDNVV